MLRRVWDVCLQGATNARSAQPEDWREDDGSRYPSLFCVCTSSSAFHPRAHAPAPCAHSSGSRRHLTVATRAAPLATAALPSPRLHTPAILGSRPAHATRGSQRRSCLLSPLASPSRTPSRRLARSRVSDQMAASGPISAGSRLQRRSAARPCTGVQVCGCGWGSALGAAGCVGWGEGVRG